MKYSFGAFLSAASTGVGLSLLSIGLLELPDLTASVASVGFVSSSVEQNSKLTTEEIHAIVKRAAIRSIAYYEGTTRDPNKDPYKIMFGGEEFQGSFDSYPEVMNCRDLCSAAVGGGQFMPPTWKGLQMNYSDWPSPIEFSPHNQDHAIFLLLKEQGAWQELERGITVLNQQVSVREENAIIAFGLVADVWCAVPGSIRRKCNGQPQATWSEFGPYFRQELVDAHEVVQ